MNLITNIIQEHNSSLTCYISSILEDKADVLKDTDSEIMFTDENLNNRKKIR